MTIILVSKVIAAVGVAVFAIPTNCGLPEGELRNYLANVYEKAASEMCTEMSEAAWNFYTDLTNSEKEAIMQNVTAKAGAFHKNNWLTYFKDLNPDDYVDENIKRQVRIVRVLGIPALSEELFNTLIQIIDKMAFTYNTAKICPYNNQNCNLTEAGLPLQPDIEDIVAKSTDYDELAYVWKAWRDATGAKIAGLYQTYVDLSNQAAVLNNGREVVCHAGAWDFCDGKNYRIKMCAQVNFKDFTTIHHEMGHIQYFMQYAKQPYSFRNGPNQGFNEAVGDTITLSAVTPKHLKKINLIQDYDDSEEASINFLMDAALRNVAFLPFGLLVDKWRWDAFKGPLIHEVWTFHWWEYRKKYQKIKPPVERSPSDFDPGAIFHVAADVQYISYFVAQILQFQFYQSLCIAAGEYEPNKEVPLHKCDFYESTEAGAKLRDGLALGASKHWSDVLEAITAVAVAVFAIPTKCAMSEDELKDFLANVYEKSASAICTKSNEAEWNFDTDINNSEKQAILLNVTLEAAAFQKSNWEQYFKDLNPDDYVDEQIKRQVKNLRILGNAALSEEKLTQLTTVTNTMTNIYSTAKICPYSKQNCDLSTEGLSLEPGMEAVLAKSTDYDELAYVWKAWRDASGAKMRDSYKTYVDLSNEAAVANKFQDKGELWRYSYESPTFIEDMDELWSQVEPLYVELHKYVGKKLKERFGSKLDDSDGLLPAHVFGNMWAQEWNNIAQLVKPFPNASKVDVDASLKEQNYTVLKMFQTSDHFYQSMGLIPNEICYDTSKGAMIEKPTDGREVLCHASAWDFCDGINYRIKMCTEVNFEDFTTIHHEMGHIQYFLQYAKKPYNFRDGANPGFHEAVGDTIALSVSTPKHLEKINLIQEYEDNEESALNSLMDAALQKVAFLPFGLLIDKWRWDVFSGAVQPEQWNSHWWEYRNKYQKVKPPVERSEKDFDPGAKFHVAGDSQYIAYFVAHIVQFQFYKSLCIAAGQYDPISREVPLHKCDFYESPEAGAKLRDGLSLGASKHWSDVLEVMTEERELDASALLEYFDPLYKFLQEQNSK
ncbi:hypothetical protein BDFB_008530 [Asbolus verrucosus]|uniref:Angiotensin-converting enzyme n=1 Tax=Asbolus verrucosus TaxID=1661398 RepID=A0A482V799_ASBVE|nr:hypothetical protein BDFB_008530 [Asbolus verrucosus]